MPMAGRPATSSDRSGWRSPGAPSRRRSSARWSCWGASGRWRASSSPWRASQPEGGTGGDRLTRREDRLEETGDQALGRGLLDDVQDRAVEADRERRRLGIDVAAIRGGRDAEQLDGDPALVAEEEIGKS